MTSSDENPDATLAKTRSNSVTLVSSTLSGVSFVSGSLVITTDQPYEVPPTIAQNGEEWTITLQAGRSKSADVATKFNTASGGMGKEYAPKRGGDGTPDELNFYFQLTLGFSTGGSVTVYVGQGSSVLVNNWWIGGSAISSVDVPKLEYTVGNSIYTLELSGDNDTFEMTQTDVRPVSPIRNVFVLMLENHSFDNMLALSGIPGIIAATSDDTNSYAGTVYPFGGGAPGAMPTDPGHEFTDVLAQLAGPDAVYHPNGPYPPIDSSGFVENYATTTTEGPTPPAADIGEIMQGFDTQSQLPTLYELASNYVVCDQWFSSLPGPTWPNRFFLHGASSNGLDHSPTTAQIVEWELPDGLGFDYPNGSIFDRLNAAGITYRLYHDTNGPLEGAVSQVSALKGIEMWDVHAVDNLASDLSSVSPPYSYQYTFIEPNYGDVINGTYEKGTSQHPMDSVAGGEGLIEMVYEAIRNSPVWNQSLLIITYDEHGGFYDHVAPPGATMPGDGGSKYSKYGFDFSQYGVRVPAVVVSPWTGAGVVDHTVYDHTSVLATLEFLFGLQPLTRRDATANSLHTLITSTLRVDTPTMLERATTSDARASRSIEVQKSEKELEPIPDGSPLIGTLGVLLKADRKLSGKAAARARFEQVKTRGDARKYLREIMAKVDAVRAAGGVK